MQNSRNILAAEPAATVPLENPTPAIGFLDLKPYLSNDFLGQWQPYSDR
jgi:hypothetical protein